MISIWLSCCQCAEDPHVHGPCTDLCMHPADRTRPGQALRVASGSPAARSQGAWMHRRRTADAQSAKRQKTTPVSTRVACSLLKLQSRFSAHCVSLFLDLQPSGLAELGNVSESLSCSCSGSLDSLLLELLVLLNISLEQSDELVMICHVCVQARESGAETSRW